MPRTSPAAPRPRTPVRRLLLLLGAALTAAALLAPGTAAGGGGSRRDRSVVLVLIDGLRWQEVFTGADPALMNRESGGVADVEALKKEFWRDTPEERRAALMPFLWQVVARQGQLIGNQAKGSIAEVTNTFHFSYPGYSEMIVGYADPRLDSNARRPNPNVSVFEWLHRKPAYRDRVAVFGAWDVVSWIVNQERCGFYVNAGSDPVTRGRISPRQELLNRLKREIPSPWGAEPYDAVTFYAALEYLRENRPRAFWLTFGETDEWAHAGRYDRYLHAARTTDGFLRTLWDALQADRQYRGRTTLLVCVDHGRGPAPEGWKSHGSRIPGSKDIWLAAIGPDTPALGERTDAARHTQAQVAATVAAALGEDYRAAVPAAAPPLAGVLAARPGRPARR